MNHPSLWYRSGRLTASTGNIHGFLGKQALLPNPRTLWYRATRLVWMEQVHGDSIRVVTKEMLAGKGRFVRIPKTDGLITNLPDVVLVVRTADCVPILAIDPVSHAVAAVHAGWKGTASNIQGRLVERFEKDLGIPPGQLVVAIGPHIGSCCYEIKQDVASIFFEKGLSECIEKRNTAIYLDLGMASRILLERAGVSRGHIETLRICTRRLCIPLASFRRDGLSGLENVGFIVKVPTLSKKRGG